MLQRATLNQDWKLLRLRVVVVPTPADDDNHAFMGSNLAIQCAQNQIIDVGTNGLNFNAHTQNQEWEVGRHDWVVMRRGAS